MWSLTAVQRDPALDEAINLRIRYGLFNDALQLAKDYEQRTGCKHYKWEDILTGLVRQDEEAVDAMEISSAM